MPTYEYECRKCGHAFDQFQKMTDKPLGKCPKCKGRLVRLVGSGAGIIFKGSGFYATDYKKKDGGGASGSASPAKKETSEASGVSKTETKAETKSDTKTVAKTE